MYVRVYTCMYSRTDIHDPFFCLSTGMLEYIFVCIYDLQIGMCKYIFAHVYDLEKGVHKYIIKCVYV
jgi:hypothetical protein